MKRAGKTVVVPVWMSLCGVDTRMGSADSGQRNHSRQNLAHRHRRASLKRPLPIVVDRLRDACPENVGAAGLQYDQCTSFQRQFLIENGQARHLPMCWQGSRFFMCVIGSRLFSREPSWCVFGEGRECHYIKVIHTSKRQSDSAMLLFSQGRTRKRFRWRSRNQRKE